jgi:hypothetical protein
MSRRTSLLRSVQTSTGCSRVRWHPCKDHAVIHETCRNDGSTLEMNGTHGRRRNGDEKECWFKKRRRARKSGSDIRFRVRIGRADPGACPSFVEDSEYSIHLYANIKSFIGRLRIRSTFPCLKTWFFTNIFTHRQYQHLFHPAYSLMITCFTPAIQMPMSSVSEPVLKRSMWIANAVSRSRTCIAISCFSHFMKRLL